MKIIGIGEVVWDCFPEGKRLGGAPINFCFFAKEFGSYPSRTAYFKSFSVRAV